MFARFAAAGIGRYRATLEWNLSHDLFAASGTKPRVRPPPIIQHYWTRFCSHGTLFNWGGFFYIRPTEDPKKLEGKGRFRKKEISRRQSANNQKPELSYLLHTPFNSFLCIYIFDVAYGKGRQSTCFFGSVAFGTKETRLDTGKGTSDRRIFF